MVAVRELVEGCLTAVAAVFSLDAGRSRTCPLQWDRHGLSGIQRGILDITVLTGAAQLKHN